MSSGDAKEAPAMRALATIRARLLLVTVLTVAGLALPSSGATAAPVSINLCATAGTTAMPGGITVPIWGFSGGGTGATPDCTGVTATLPGPALTVVEGDVVTVNVTNALPAGTAAAPHELSFEIPGADFGAGPVTAAVGATVSRTFTASRPGTFLYQSGGDAGRQEAMGLYGALIVRPVSGGVPIAGQAYHPASTAFDVEATLVLSALDPAFNAAPDTFDMKRYTAAYWLINGRAYSADPGNTTAPVVASAGQRVLLRYLNAGFDNTTMLLLGTHQRVLAREARLLGNPFEAAAETIPAGATEDAFLTVPAFAPPAPNGFPLYNRQLHLTNGELTGATPAAGGMLTFIRP
jgi:FtsP/CotA-like multicopper oxidase with cupredoxin domain